MTETTLTRKTLVPLVKAACRARGLPQHVRYEGQTEPTHEVAVAAIIASSGSLSIDEAVANVARFAKDQQEKRESELAARDEALRTGQALAEREKAIRADERSKVIERMLSFAIDQGVSRETMMDLALSMGLSDQELGALYRRHT